MSEWLALRIYEGAGVLRALADHFLRHRRPDTGCVEKEKIFRIEVEHAVLLEFQRQRLADDGSLVRFVAAQIEPPQRRLDGPAIRIEKPHRPTKPPKADMCSALAVSAMGQRRALAQHDSFPPQRDTNLAR